MKQAHRRARLALLTTVTLLTAVGCGQYEGAHQEGLAQGANQGLGGSDGGSSGLAVSTTGSSGSGARPGAGGATGTSGTATGGATGSGTVTGGAPLPRTPQGSSGPYAGEVGVTKDSITIGWIYPRSGPGAAATTNIEPAIETALKEINAAGGIFGRRLVAKYGDDGYPSDPSVALASAKAMSNSSFGVTTGGIFSDFGATYDYLSKRKIPHLFYNADRATALRLRSGFTTTTFVESQAEMLPQFMIAKFDAKTKKIGIISHDTPDLRPAVNAFKRKAKQAGLNVVVSQPLDAVPSSCINEVQKLKNSGAQVVWLAVGVLAVPCVLRDAKAIGYTPTWTGTGNFWTANVVNQAAGCQTEGIIAMASSHAIDSPAGQHYKAMMAKYYPNDADARDDDIAWLLYGMAHTWAEGLRRAGPFPTRTSFVSGMETMRAWQGRMYAPLTFGPSDRLGGRGVLTVKAVNCRWREIDTNWRTRF